MTDIIEDVLMSTTKEPSVASVVFDTFKDFVSPEEEAASQDKVAEDEEYSLDDIMGELSDDKAQPEQQEEEKKEASPEPEPFPTLELKEEDAPVSDDSSKTITFSGKPVPETGTVVVNGYASSPAEEMPSSSPLVEDNQKENTPREKESPLKEKEPPVAAVDKKDKVPEPQKSESLPATSISQANNKSKTPAPVPTPVPQTDLDTFETRMSSLVEDLDKKSDTGSANTEDSLGDMVEPEREAETVQVQRRQKGNIRPRNVSCHFISFCSIMSLLTIVFLFFSFFFNLFVT